MKGWWSVVLVRLRWLLGRAHQEDEMDRELRFHLEQQIEENLATGMTAQDARRRAHLTFGALNTVKDDCRDVSVYRWFENACQDVRYGVRSLRRSPGLVAVSALSLGLGVGVNLVLYSAVKTVYANRPTIADADRVVGVEPGNANQLSYPNYRDLQRTGIFSDAVGFRTTSLILRSGDSVRRVGGLAVTANFFDALGIAPQLGQAFSGDDASPERDPYQVVLSHGFWRTRLGRDPEVIGSMLNFNGQPFVVRGVLSEGHQSVIGWVAPPLYVPVSALTLKTIEDRGSPSLSVMARLASDATADETQRAVTSWASEMERAYPERNDGLGQPASLFPAYAVQFRGSEGTFLLLGAFGLGAFGLVLVIAAVNVAGLLMARAVHRRREIAIRVALGAGRARVIQSTLTESFLLVLVGAAVGFPLAAVLTQMWLPANQRVLREAMALDITAIPYAVVLIVATSLLCGLLPALAATRPSIGAEIRQGGAEATALLGVRHGLVVAQVAFSLLLIVAASLCVRSQIRLGSVDLGFDIDHGVVARFDLDAASYSAEDRVRFAEWAVERVAAIPGISSASVASIVPLGGDSLVASFHPAGRSDIPGSRPLVRSVGPRYFETLAISLLIGRDFDDTDIADAPPVAIINETFASTHLSDGDVIGQRVQVGQDPEAVVVGLVRDNKIGTIGETPKSVLYYPYAQQPTRLIVHGRTTGPPQAVVELIRQQVSDLDRMVPVSVQTLRSATSLELEMRWLGMVLIGGIGVIGLLLAMVGLSGVMAYVVASRSAEAGIRMALGASPLRIRLDVLRQAFGLVAVGVAIGLAMSASLMPAFGTFLAVVSPFDPAAFGGAAVLMAVAGLVASYLPAARLSRTDPILALRQS